MFREMFLVTALAKYRENDASAVDAAEVLKMATTGGAKAMNLSDCDVLVKGKQARSYNDQPASAKYAANPQYQKESGHTVGKC